MSVHSFEQQPIIPTHETEYHPEVRELFDVYGETLHSESRVIYPNPELGENEIRTRLFESIAEDKLDGAYVALVDGAFDVPHDNHEWYLRHCRLLAARQMLESKSILPTTAALRDAVADPSLRLIVTVDADAKVAAKKGGKAEKGGIPRPVYPWESRAHRLAGYHFVSSDNTNHHTVNYVTVEGDPGHVGTSLESSLVLGEALAAHGLLDSMIVYGEHDATVQEAVDRGLNPIVIPDTYAYAVDPRTQEEYKSSKIIKMIRNGQ